MSADVPATAAARRASCDPSRRAVLAANQDPPGARRPRCPRDRQVHERQRRSAVTAGRPRRGAGGDPPARCPGAPALAGRGAHAVIPTSLRARVSPRAPAKRFRAATSGPLKRGRAAAARPLRECRRRGGIRPPPPPPRRTAGSRRRAGTRRSRFASCDARAHPRSTPAPATFTSAPGSPGSR